MYVCIPAGVGGPPEQLFTIQRQKTKSRSNSETKNLFPSRHCFCRLFPCSACPWPQSALLGRVPHCLPQDRGLSPPPLPTGPGETPSHPKMLLPRWLRCPFEFLLLVYCFWDSGPRKKGLISHLERLMGEGKWRQQVVGVTGRLGVVKLSSLLRGVGRVCKGERSPSLPYTLLQGTQSQVPGPAVRTPLYWGLYPQPIDSGSFRLGMSPEYLFQHPPLQPLTLASPAPTL